VLSETDLPRAVGTCDRLRQAVAAHQFVLNGERVPVTVSVGVASTDGDPELTRERLMSAADARLYRAKADGRNRVAS
jgi:diguanylate cyclase (GGDEF)-like protein